MLALVNHDDLACFSVNRFGKILPPSLEFWAIVVGKWPNNEAIWSHWPTV